MLCHHDPPPESPVVAVFVDLENILNCRETNREGLFGDLTSFLAAIRIQLHLAGLSLHPKYSRLYLERQWWHTEMWRQRYIATANQQGFLTVWTPPNQPAESALEVDILEILASAETLPRIVIIFSGDGDLIPLIDTLHWRRHEICVVSKPERLNPWLHLVASGIVDFYHLTAVRSLAI